MSVKLVGDQGVKTRGSMGEGFAPQRFARVVAGAGSEPRGGGVARRIAEAVLDVFTRQDQVASVVAAAACTMCECGLSVSQ